MRAVLALTALLGCRSDFQLQPAVRGSEPLADAGIGAVVRIASPITLDGSGSIDPDGSIARYEWKLLNAPAGSTASIVDASLPITALTPDVAGDFELELEVTDDAGNRDQSRVSYRVLLLPLTVEAGTDLTVDWRKRTQLTGQILNAEGEAPTLTWSFVSKPARSTAVLESASTLTPSFVADAVGTYVVQLVATTSMHTSTDTLTITATSKQIPFQGAFIDAVFDDQQNQLLAISDGPPRLRLIDPVTGAETSITLPSTPIALSMDPASRRLAVATNGKIHIFDLVTKTLTVTHNVSFTIANVVFAPFGLVHCFTPQAGPIQTIDAEDGTVTTSAYSVSAGSVAKMAPNSSDLYSLDTTVTPADLTHHVSVAPTEFFRDSPYAGEYAFGGNLWIPQVDTLYVRAGNAFQLSSFVETDMVFRAHLGGDEPSTLEYAFAFLPKVLTLHARAGATPNYQLRLYDEVTLALLEAAPLPEIMVNGVAQASTGRLIGYSTSYANHVVIVASAGTSNAFIVTPL